MSTYVVGRNPLTGTVAPAGVSEDGLHVAQYVCDTNTLSWIKQTGSSGTGSDVSVTNFPSVQQVSGTVATTVYSKRFDEADATTSYVGEAAAGSSEGSAVWRIQRIVSSGADLTITFADGNTNFDNVWTNRASLSYS